MNKENLFKVSLPLLVLVFLVVFGIYNTTSAKVPTKSASTNVAAVADGSAICTPICASSRLTASSTLDFNAIVSGGCDTKTLSVTGADNGDVVNVGMPNSIANASSTLLWNGWVSSSDVVSVRLCQIGPKKTSNFAPDTVTVDVWR